MNLFRDAEKSFEIATRDETDTEFLPIAARLFIAFINVVHSRNMTMALLADVIDTELQKLAEVVSVVEAVEPNEFTLEIPVKTDEGEQTTVPVQVTGDGSIVSDTSGLDHIDKEAVQNQLPPDGIVPKVESTGVDTSTPPTKPDSADTSSTTSTSGSGSKKNKNK